VRCPICGRETEGDFCAYCAGSLQKQEGQPSWERAAAKVTVEFGRSTSSNYDFAVELAMKHPSYATLGTGKDVTHRVTVGLEEIDFLRSLLNYVGDWKSTRLYLDDRLTPYGEISQVLHCYYERQKVFNPEEYCYGRDDIYRYNDNDLGCRHCGANPYDHHGLAGFGTMLANGSFAVDKDRLIYTVARNLGNKGARGEPQKLRAPGVAACWSYWSS
jgi:hypothetical protein